MALKLPKEGHPVRELFDCAEVENMTPTRYKLLPTITEARKDAKARFKTDGRLDLVSALVRHEDGRVLLMTFGRRGGYKARWNFGRMGGLTFNCRWPNCGCDPTKLRDMKAHPCAENDAKCSRGNTER